MHFTITPQQQYEAAHRHAALFDVSNRTTILLAGRDRAAFLHNFCTNDIKGLPVGRGCEAYLCNAKGKILAQLGVFALAQSLWLDAEPKLGPKIIAHLERYVITEDVTLQDRSAACVRLLLAGPEAAGLPGLEAAPLRELDVRTATIAGIACELCRHDVLGVPSYHVLAATEAGGQTASLWRHLEERGVTPAGPECYETLRVEAAFPEYGLDVDETNYPQEVGRDERTLSFTKGCYLGQEPVVMIRDRGQVHRLLTGLKLEGSTPAAHGAKLWRDGKEIGHVTSSVVSPRLGCAIALGYVRRGSHEPGTRIEIAGGDGGKQAATVTKLPFA